MTIEGIAAVQARIQEIQQQVTSVLNWSFGGALGVMLLVAAIVTIVLFRGLLHLATRRMAAA